MFVTILLRVHLGLSSPGLLMLWFLVQVVHLFLVLLSLTRMPQFLYLVEYVTFLEQALAVSILRLLVLSQGLLFSPRC